MSGVFVDGFSLELGLGDQWFCYFLYGEFIKLAATRLAQNDLNYLNIC